MQIKVSLKDDPYEKKKQPEHAHLHVVQWVSVMLAVTFGTGNCSSSIYCYVYETVV